MRSQIQNNITEERTKGKREREKKRLGMVDDVTDILRLQKTDGPRTRKGRMSSVNLCSLKKKGNCGTRIIKICNRMIKYTL